MKSWLQRIRRLTVVNYPVRIGIRSGYRFFAASRLRWPVSGTVEVAYDNVKLKLYNRSDDGFVQLFYYDMKYQESNILRITDAFAKKSAAILDIGANTGIDALIVAKKNPATTIIAIEPYAPNYERLEKNLALNSVANIVLKKIAVGAKRDTIEFFAPEDGRITDVASAVEGIGERVYGNNIRWKKIQVQQCALDDIYDDISGIGFFKCDVEGYEMDVFMGAKEFFARQQPTFIVEIVLNADSVAFFNQFATRHGYTIYYLTPEGLVKLNELFAIDWRGDFLFSRYCHPRNYVSMRQVDEFVDSAWRVAAPA
jgi:FkbM family methyltransferase